MNQVAYTEVKIAIKSKYELYFIYHSQVCRLRLKLCLFEY